MRPFACVSLLLTLLLQCQQQTSAFPARDVPFDISQPDGSVIRIHGNGDERDSWLSDELGYGIVQDENGIYVYFDESEDGAIVTSAEKVSKGGPKETLSKKKGLHKAPTDCSKKLCGGTPKDPDMKVDRNANSRRKMGQIRGAKVSSIELLQEDAQGMKTKEVGLGRRRTEDGEEESTQQTMGVLKNLVVLLEFQDHSKDKRRREQIPSTEDIDTLMNRDEPDPVLCPVGSLKSIYKELSYGQLVIESTVTEWYVTEQTEAWYADGDSGTTNLHQAIRDALDYLDENSMVNFTDFDTDGDGKIDAITILHSGFAAEWISSDEHGARYQDRIWSHKWNLWSDASGDFRGPWQSKDGVKVWEYHISPALWGISGSEIGHIGVIAHETGHFLGIPDLYDSDGGGNGLGNFCVMANSWGWDKTQEPPGTMSCWTKMALGWLTPQTPAYGINTISDSSYSQDCYLIGDGDFGFPYGEYLLVENRQPTGMDATLLQGGLAIYHVDEYARFDNEGHPGQNNWPRNGRHYRIALLGADGMYDLEQRRNYGDATDLFHGDGVNQIMPSENDYGPYPNTDSYQLGKIKKTNVQIFDISKSNDTMTFTFTDGAVALPTFSPTTSDSPSSTISLPPSESPSILSSAKPTSTPSVSSAPSLRPSENPSATPTISLQPTEQPSTAPSMAPSASAEPTQYVAPSVIPSDFPSLAPTRTPTSRPSTAPMTSRPSSIPSLVPSQYQCSEQGQICRTDVDCCNEKAKCKEDKGNEAFVVDIQYLCSK